MAVITRKYTAFTGEAISAFLSKGAFRLSFRARIIAFAAALMVPSIIVMLVLTQSFMYSSWLFLDMKTAAELSGACCSPAYGAVSTLGAMIWMGAGFACLLAAAVFGRAHTDLRDFALLAGALTLCLALDDIFMVHEYWLPMIGISEKAVYVVYAAIAAAYVTRAWRVLAASDYWILGLAGAALVGSIGIDTIVHSMGPRAIAAEDGAKFIGICAWATFHLATIGVALRGIVTDCPASLHGRGARVG